MRILVLLLAGWGTARAATFDCNLGISRLNVSSGRPFPSSVLTLPLNYSFLVSRHFAAGLTYAYHRFNDPSYSYYTNFRFTGHELGVCLKAFGVREQIKAEGEAGYAVSAIKGGMDYFSYIPIEHIEPIRMDGWYQAGHAAISVLYYLYGFYVGTYVTCKLMFRQSPCDYASERLTLWGMGLKVNRQFKVFF